MGRQHPNRIGTWLPDEDTWLHDCLEDLAREFTEQKGVRTTKGDLVRAALLMAYGERKNRYVQPSSQVVCIGGGPLVVGGGPEDRGYEEEGRLEVQPQLGASAVDEERVDQQPVGVGD